MSYTVTIDGEDVTSPVSLRGGILHVMVRAEDKATFDALALEVGVLVEDEERGLIPARPVDLCRIGHPVRIPAQTDAQGNVVVPAVMDDAYHVNVWIDTGRATGVRALLRDLAAKAARSLNKRKNEAAYSYKGAEVIDPDTVATPANRLA